jgi:DeoR/GlpR family transcriptional regulator of sugar metabolism
MYANVAEAAVDRAFVRQASKVAVVADHFKWGHRALARIVSLREVDVVVTDESLDRSWVDRIVHMGIDLKVGMVDEIISSS